MVETTESRPLTAIEELLYMIPESDEYAYIEARVGSENYRSEARLIIDRRGTPKAGRSGYENHPANDWLPRLVIFANKVRAALRSTSRDSEVDRLRAFAEKVAASENDTPGTRASARYALTGSLEGAVDEMRRAADIGDSK